MKILSRLVSVVNSIVEVKGEVEVGGTGDFEVAELQNLIDVVDHDVDGIPFFV